jgi:hypothetical protein
MAMIAVLAIVAVVIILPHPEVWEHLFADRDHPRAVLVAYRFALTIPRPAGVPLNGLTYTFLVRSISPDLVEVVFLPRNFVRRLWNQEAEQIQVFVRKPTMAVTEWYFGE